MRRIERFKEGKFILERVKVMDVKMDYLASSFDTTTVSCSPKEAHDTCT